jgi:N-acyl-D-amino-acid deacylase
MPDILIQDAVIVDGTGAPRFQADVAIQGDCIASIGSLDGASARTTIDAAGRVLLPGFIDMHSHADLSLLVEPEAESLVRQGITTVVTGQCGQSPAPLLGPYRDDALQTLSMLLPSQAAMPWDELSTFASFLDYLQGAGTAPNVVPLVGQGMVRAAVMGFSSDAPSKGQMAQMQSLVHQALDAGAYGLSTGLIYPPGSFTTTPELVDVTGPVGQRGGLYFSHIRNEARGLAASVSEAIEIGRRNGAAVQISHLKAAGRDNWHRVPAALELIDEARSQGLDVTADMYPYTGGATYMAALLPRWALEGGTPGLLKRLDDPQEWQRIAQDLEGGDSGIRAEVEWDKVLISGSPDPAQSGRSIADLAAQESQEPVAWMLDALRAASGKMGMVALLIDEENIRLQLRHPAVMVGTDSLGVSAAGPMARGIMHPRFCGTYARIFGQYVRDEGLLSLEEASWKASGFPAQKLGLAGRGLIREGLKADLVVLDPETVADRASFAKPLRYPVGIDNVLVNGELVVAGGEAVGARPGTVLRR